MMRECETLSERINLLLLDRPHGQSDEKTAFAYKCYGVALNKFGHIDFKIRDSLIEALFDMTPDRFRWVSEDKDVQTRYWIHRIS